MIVVRLQWLQYRGNAISTVSCKTMVFVRPPHFGQRMNPRSLILMFISCSSCEVGSRPEGTLTLTLRRKKGTATVPATRCLMGDEGPHVKETIVPMAGVEPAPAQFLGPARTEAPPVVLHRHGSFLCFLFFQGARFMRGAPLFPVPPGGFTPIILVCTKILLILDIAIS